MRDGPLAVLKWEKSLRDECKHRIELIGRQYEMEALN